MPRKYTMSEKALQQRRATAARISELVQRANQSADDEFDDEPLSDEEVDYELNLKEEKKETKPQAKPRPKPTKAQPVDDSNKEELKQFMIEMKALKEEWEKRKKEKEENKPKKQKRDQILTQLTEDLQQRSNRKDYHSNLVFNTKKALFDAVKF